MNTRNLFAASAIAVMAASVISAPASAKDRPVNAANNNEYAVTGTAPVANVTPFDNAFTCFAQYLATDKRRPVFSVGKLTDQTGKFSNEAAAGGYEVSQGLTNMAYTALGKLAPDFNIVERTDTGIADMELGLASQTLLSDASEANGLRHKRGGQYVGADFYITGAITEINYNVDSGGAEINVAQIGGGRRTYSMTIAMDLRVVDSKTLRVIKTVSERKVIKGYEVKAGVFNFLGNYLIDINIGKKAQEPVDLGVRATMEAGLLRLVGAVYQTPYGEQCAAYATDTYGNVPAVMAAEVVTKK